MADLICPICGYEGRPQKQLRGSSGMEWFLWLSFLLPGPLYSFWRRASIKRPCPNCRYPALVKKTSAEGKMAQRKLDAELGLIPAVTKHESVPLVVNAPRVERINKPPADPEKW